MRLMYGALLVLNANKRRISRGNYTRTAVTYQTYCGNGSKWPEPVQSGACATWKERENLETLVALIQLRRTWMEPRSRSRRGARSLVSVPDSVLAACAECV